MKMLFNGYPYYVFKIFQLEATNHRLRELEEQVALEMQAKDEVEHNYRLDNQHLMTCFTCKYNN